MIGKGLSAVGGTTGAVALGGSHDLARPPLQAGNDLSKSEIF